MLYVVPQMSLPQLTRAQQAAEELNESASLFTCILSLWTFTPERLHQLAARAPCSPGWLGYDRLQEQCFKVELPSGELQPRNFSNLSRGSLIGGASSLPTGSPAGVASRQATDSGMDTLASNTAPPSLVLLVPWLLPPLSLTNTACPELQEANVQKLAGNIYAAARGLTEELGVVEGSALWDAVHVGVEGTWNDDQWEMVKGAVEAAVQ